MRQKVIALRRRRFTGQHIAAETGVSPSTVSRILKRAGLSRLKDLEPQEPVRRYERSRPREMLHIDIKKLGRFAVPGHRAAGTRQNCRNQTALREWAYGRIYSDSSDRSSELPRWLHRYNWHRPHGSLNSKLSVSPLPLSQGNLLRFHS